MARIKIIADNKYAQDVLRAIEEAYKAEERRPSNKWHVYDLLFSRKTVATRLKFSGYKTTREDIGFFFLGKAVHTEIQRILGIEKSEIGGEKFGVLATMDYLDKKGVEIKSSRKWTVPELPEAHYVRQGGYYAAIFELDSVWILVIYPTAGRKWNGKQSSTVEAKSWQILTPRPVRKQIEYDMLRSRDEIEKAIKTRNFSVLPPAPTWTVERFGKRMPDGNFKDYEKEIRQHPFWYAWRDKGWL